MERASCLLIGMLLALSLAELSAFWFLLGTLIALALAGLSEVVSLRRRSGRGAAFEITDEALREYGKMRKGLLSRQKGHGPTS